jgi:hypothetical protein
VVYEVLFFQSSLLSDGFYTLVITNAGTSVEYQLDHIDFNASTNVPVSTLSGSSGSSSSRIVSTTSSVSRPAAATSPASSSAKSAPVGTIVGTIAAGLLVVLIALLIYFNCRRRKSNATPAETAASSSCEVLVRHLQFVNLWRDSLYRMVFLIPYLFRETPLACVHLHCGLSSLFGYFVPWSCFFKICFANKVWNAMLHVFQLN